MDVTVEVDDTEVGTTPDDSAPLSITITDANEPPTVSLTNVTTSLSEATDTTSAIKVAEIVVDDDALGTNVLALSGTHAALFEIVGTDLYLKAGTTLDYETVPQLDVTVEVDDAAIGATPDASAPLSIAITDANEAPTVSLTNVTTSLSEATDTTSAVKVAEIVIADDALGTNVLALSGTHAALFEIIGTDLYLKAGTVLDFETVPQLDVTVEVDDTEVGTTPDDSAPLSITITDANEPPTVSLTNVTTSRSEAADTSSAVKVAEIVVADDLLGTNTLSLSGMHASLFEISGSDLYLKAGTVLDYETVNELNVTVEVDDTEVGTTPDDSAPLSITITDANEAPTVTLTNVTTTLSEATDTSSAVKVAEIVIADDALGTNVLAFSGTHAALFEIIGSDLYLKAGTVLDYETVPQLDVTVEVDDTEVGTTPDDSAPLSITITDANEPPMVSLTNVTTSLSEATDTTSAIKVAEIVVDDDALGTNVLALSGTHAALFEIVGTDLYLKAGTVLDFETVPQLDVTVEVDDAAIGATPDASAPLSIAITDANEPPTVSLTNVTTSLSEAADTSSAIKVAEIVIPDDALGTNTLALSGTHAALFEIVGTDLYLKAGTALDFETVPQLDVTVEVDDTEVGSTPDDSAPLSITITDANEPPTVALTNVTTSLSEATDTTSAIKVAEIVITDDALGTNVLALSGTHAALFEISGTDLYLKAGTTLDYETVPQLDVTVEVDDAAIGATPDASAPLSIAITDANEPPTVSLTNVTTSLSEAADTSSAIKVAEIVIPDDALGTNTLALSGTHAALFEISGTDLYLKAGTPLNYETVPQLDVTVEVDDTTVGSTPDDSVAFSITITDANDPPTVVITGLPASPVEGTEILLAADVSDPDGDETFTYAWSVTKNGVSYDTGESITTESTFTFTPDDDGTYVVSVSVSDGVGQRTVSETIVVGNVGPTLELSGAPSVVEGSIYTLNLSSADPGDDTISQWEINWGDGSSPEIFLGNPASVEHIYADGYTVFAITATATDEDGTYDILGSGPAGQLDISFDTDGKLTTDFAGGWNEAQAVALQPDGKVVVAGYTYNGGNSDFALARYNADGSLDVTFGSGGLVTTDFAGRADSAYALVVQSNGKLLLAGRAHNGTDYDFAVARYNADGSLDTSFSADGLVTIDLGGSEQARTMAVQTDGKILLTGDSNGDFAVVRYNADGSLDASFGTAGVLTTDFAGGTDIAYDLLVQRDGKIVVVGDAYNGSSHDFALARYDEYGLLDTSFGTGGLVMTDFAGGYDGGYAVALQSDGKIVVAGQPDTGGVGLVRYQTDGSLDTDFGIDGKVTTELNGTWPYHMGLVIQSDGKIVVAAGDDMSSNGFHVVRYAEDGSLDTDFGTGGKVATSFGGWDHVADVTLDSKGRIIAVGTAINVNNLDFAVARYFSGPARLPVTVNNVAPMLTVVGNQTIATNQQLNLTDLGTFSDPGFDNPLDVPPTVETFTYSIDWGDGSEADTGVAAIDIPGEPGIATQGSFNGSHTYTLKDVYTVTVTLTDDDGGSHIATFEVLVNAPPVVSSIEKTVDEDVVLTFGAADFAAAFSDVDTEDSLQTVRITSLPSHGTLSLSGVAVVADQEITAADLANLTYQGDLNYHGADGFTWDASDGTVYSGSPAAVNITVNSLNDAPVLSSIEKTVDEDAVLAFGEADFAAAFNDVDTEDSLQTVRITSLPSHGTLSLSGVAVVADQEITAADLANLTYQGDLNYHGADGFTWDASDGTVYSGSPAAVNITVNSVNDAPVLNSIQKTVDEDAVLPFDAADFAAVFSDVDTEDSLQTVQITSLPSHGTLSLSGVAVVADQEITAADLANLTYQGDLNYHGADGFTWDASDGTAYSGSPAAVNITVNSLNDAPVLSSFGRTVDEDAVLAFGEADFAAAFNDVDMEDSLQTVRITSLPSHGTLSLSGVAVVADQEITAADLANLTYQGDLNYHGADGFTWDASDGHRLFRLAGCREHHGQLSERRSRAEQLRKNG